MDMLDWVLVSVALALIGAVVVSLLLNMPMRRPPAESTKLRDLMIAQNRVLSGRKTRPGEPEWDGLARAPVDAEPGGGYG